VEAVTSPARCITVDDRSYVPSSENELATALNKYGLASLKPEDKEMEIAK
jgi:hypothetical protein